MDMFSENLEVVGLGGRIRHILKLQTRWKKRYNGFVAAADQAFMHSCLGAHEPPAPHQHLVLSGTRKHAKSAHSDSDRRSDRSTSKYSIPNTAQRK